MKKVVLILILATAAAGILVSQSPRKGENIGAGIIIGEPTGLSMKIITSRSTALDFAGGWSLSNSSFYVHADYLLGFYGIPLGGGREIPIYTGIGAKLDIRAEDSESLRLGVRIPLGASYYITATPFELFLEIAPSVLVIPETRIDFGGGIGVRFYF